MKTRSEILNLLIYFQMRICNVNIIFHGILFIYLQYMIRGFRFLSQMCLKKSDQRLFQSSNIDMKTSLFWKYYCPYESDLEDFGKKLATVLDTGDTIFLVGDLGAGKTTLARGLIRKVFEDDEMIITSPSYLLDNRYDYDENKAIHHIDLYRLPTGCDLSMLDIPNIYTNCICLIEWPQRISNKFLPNDYLHINISITSNQSRHLQLSANSMRWKDKLLPILGSPNHFLDTS